MPSRTIFVIVGEDDRDRPGAASSATFGTLRAAYRRAAFLAGAISVAGDIEVLPAALAGANCVASGADLTLAAFAGRARAEAGVEALLGFGRYLVEDQPAGQCGKRGDQRPVETKPAARARSSAPSWSR